MVCPNFWLVLCNQTPQYDAHPAVYLDIRFIFFLKYKNNNSLIKSSWDSWFVTNVSELSKRLGETVGLNRKKHHCEILAMHEADLKVTWPGHPLRELKETMAGRTPLSWRRPKWIVCSETRQGPHRGNGFLRDWRLYGNSTAGMHDLHGNRGV